MLVCGRNWNTMMLYDGADFNIANRAGPRYITTVTADGKSTVDHQDTLAALSQEELAANMTIAEGHMSFYRDHCEQLKRVFHRDDKAEKRMCPSPLELRLRNLLHKSETIKTRPLPTSLPLLSQEIERYFQDEKQAEVDMYNAGTATECPPARHAGMDSAVTERRLDSVQTEAFAVSERLHEAIGVILSIIGTGVSSDLAKVPVS